MVQKDRFGIRLTFYAVLAFVLAILGQTLLCGLLLGFVILVHGNEWLTRQVMQAFFLCLFNGIVSAVTAVFSALYAVPILGAAIGGVLGFIGGILSLVVLILAVVALVRVSKGGEASLPLANSLADKAFGRRRMTQYYTPDDNGPAGPAPQPPVQPGPPAEGPYSGSAQP